ncbi:hypothetical protein [Yoonia sp.]|uniref:hypothetical protein n=1 Tax=Yoonia sp. TaxID=2212373 RepID=UPI00391BA8B1
MNRLISTCAALLLTLPVSTTLQAGEAAFLQQFSGSWAGGGAVRLSPEDSAINVSCEFHGQSTESTATLDGSCTGMLVVSRDINARLEVENGTYSGTYVGSPRGTAALAGDREGSSLALMMQWPGHPPAEMTLQNPAEGQMVLTTIEPHPETGEPVATAELELLRQ